MEILKTNVSEVLRLLGAKDLNLKTEAEAWIEQEELGMHPLHYYWVDIKWSGFGVIGTGDTFDAAMANAVEVFFNLLKDNDKLAQNVYDKYCLINPEGNLKNPEYCGAV